MNPDPGEIDYVYELTAEELRYSAGLDDLARLTWLDQARRFTLLAREAETTVYHDGKPVGSCAPPSGAEGTRLPDATC
ncbi:MAG TPA: hypothetical protein VJM14_18915 [Burkholderiales bacterium]|nr:hypothetical protein [Burkholderiales bacterium]